MSNLNKKELDQRLKRIFEFTTFHLRRNEQNAPIPPIPSSSHLIDRPPEFNHALHTFLPFSLLLRDCSNHINISV